MNANLYPESGKGISIAQHSKILRDETETDIEYILASILDVENTFKGKFLKLFITLNYFWKKMSDG